MHLYQGVGDVGYWQILNTSMANAEAGLAVYNVPILLCELHNFGLARALVDVLEKLVEGVVFTLCLSLNLSCSISPVEVQKPVMPGSNLGTLLSDVLRHHPVMPCSWAFSRAKYLCKKQLEMPFRRLAHDAQPCDVGCVLPKSDT